MRQEICTYIHSFVYCFMDSDDEFTLVKSIVQSGLSVDEWNQLRESKGDWPSDKLHWKPYRHYSIDKLIAMMEEYSKTNGN